MGKDFAISLRNGFSQYLKVNEEMAEDRSKLRFHVYPSQLQAGITDVRTNLFQTKDQPKLFKDFYGVDFGVWEEKRIVHWHQELKEEISFQKAIEVDLLIISHNALKEPQKLLNFIKPNKIVVDASNSYYNIQNFKAKFEEENLEYYVVPEKGAFEWTL